jgi:hypothetical protein
MRIQETLLSLERGIHLADMLGLGDADLNRFERACYQWQQAAAIELCRRSGQRPDWEDMTMGAGKSFSGVRLTEGHGHD